MEAIGKIINNKIILQGKVNGYTKIPNWFLESRKFTIYEKMTAIIIYKHQMYKKSAWPSQVRIARQIPCSITSVKKAIAGLHKKNILTIEKHKNGKNNLYIIKLLNR